MYNCPIVCNYDVSSDTIGGHDMELVNTDSGVSRLINLTDAVGVIPESAKYFWETIEEDDGSIREYFNVEVILWKRCPVYEKLQRDGFANHSMEITVHDGRLEDDVFIIENFTFTAFCLLGEDVEPCFEYSQLSLFSCARAKLQYTKMMEEFKQSFLVQDNTSFQKEDAIQPRLSLEGGENQMDKITELLTQYNVTAEEINVDIENITYEESENTLMEYTAANKPDSEPDIDDEPIVDEPALVSDTFSLTAQQFLTELFDALSEIKLSDEWGEYSRYIFCDYDSESHEVYCYDVNDWNIYGFTYSMNGDNVVVDFESKKRKKVVYTDFDNGTDPDASFQAVIDNISAYSQRSLQATNANLETQNAEANTKISELQASIKPLRNFAREQVFAQFSELNGIDEFESLKSDCGEMSLDVIREKCYAIKGKNLAQNFSNTQSSVRIPIDTAPVTNTDSRYGDFFAQYPPRI